MGLCVRFLHRPLVLECVPHLSRRQWTTFIQQLPNLVWVLHLTDPRMVRQCVHALEAVASVHLERLLVVPSPQVPTNAPRVVRETLSQIDELTGGCLARLYGGILREKEEAALGMEVVVLEQPRYRAKAFRGDTKSTLDGTAHFVCLSHTQYAANDWCSSVLRLESHCA